jgi:hypothetical protein
MKIGKIYKIIHTQSDIIYIGSTFNTLRDRWAKHKQIDSKCIISKYIQEFGSEQFKIILIKEYEVVDRAHLESKEQLWINKTKCINIQSAFNALPKISFQKANKKYREINKDKIKEYQENNKQYHIDYHKSNKKQISAKSAEYYKEKKIRINCECGGKYYNVHKLAHFKTKKHKNFTI